MKVANGNYKCFTCGCYFNWTSQSSWFGSYKELEDGKTIDKTFCTDKCSKEFYLNHIKSIAK